MADVREEEVYVREMCSRERVCSCEYIESVYGNTELDDAVLVVVVVVVVTWGGRRVQPRKADKKGRMRGGWCRTGVRLRLEAGAEGSFTQLQMNQYGQRSWPCGAPWWTAVPSRRDTWCIRLAEAWGRQWESWPCYCPGPWHVSVGIGGIPRVGLGLAHHGHPGTGTGQVPAARQRQGGSTVDLHSIALFRSHVRVVLGMKSLQGVVLIDS